MPGRRRASSRRRRRSVDGMVIVDGDEAMRKRPIGPLVTALRSLGIVASAPTGCPPVMIEGRGHFGSGRVEIDGGLSSQYVSALLMAAPFGDGPIDVALTGKDLDARGYVDLTVAAMTAFGAKVAPVDRTTWRVEPTKYRGDRFCHRARCVGGDLSLGGRGADGRQRSISACRWRRSRSPTRRRRSSSGCSRACRPSSTARRCRMRCRRWPCWRHSTTRRCASPASPICASRSATGSPRSRPSSAASGRGWRMKRATIWWWRPTRSSRARRCRRASRPMPTTASP